MAKILLVLLTLLYYTRTSRIFPDEDRRSSKTTEKIALMVDFKPCCFPFRVFPFEKDSIEDHESLFHVFATPEASILSNILPVDVVSAREPAKENDLLLLKEIEHGLRELEDSMKISREQLGASVIFSEAQILERICSYLDNGDNRAFRLVNKSFLEAQNSVVKHQLGECAANTNLSGFQANFLNLICTKGFNDAPFDDEKMLLLAEIALTMKQLDRAEIAKYVNAFEKICKLGLRELFMSIRALDFKFYMETIRKEDGSGIVTLIETGRIELLQQAIEDLQMDTTMRNMQVLFKRALVAAIQLNKPEAVKLILSGTSAAIKVSELITEIDRTPLMLAVEYNCLPCIRVLCTTGSNDFITRNSKGLTVAHFAVKLGDLEVIKYLAAEGVFLAGAGDANDRTALHYVAAMSKDAKLLRVLLNQHVDASLLMTCDIQGFIPLHYAAFSGNAESVAVLLDAIDHGIYYPSYHAIYEDEDKGYSSSSSTINFKPHTYNKFKFLRKLIVLKLQPQSLLPSSNGASACPLHLAAKLSHLEVVKVLVNRLPHLVHWRDEFGRSPFNVAVLHNQPKVVAFFLQRINTGLFSEERFSIQRPDFAGTSSLHAAIKFNYEAVFDMLLVSHLFSLNDVDGKGYTALQLAQLYGRESMIKKIKRARGVH